MTCPAIDNLASCEIHAVVGFLHAKNVSVAEIHLELWAVYGQNIVNEGNVRQWCKMVEDGRRDFHDEGRIGRPAICIE
jgi:hypothetical protein